MRTTTELYQYLEKGTKFFLFDVRKGEDFKKSHIEGSFPILNVSYFDLIEKGGKDSFIEYIKMSTKLPKDREIVVVCNRGNSSAIVTELLTNLGYQASSLVGGMKGWGELTVRKTLVNSPDLTLIQVIRPARGCLSYVVVSDKVATVIDPFRKLQPYLEIFEELKVEPQFILDTHAHADHISGARELAERFHIPYFLHPYDGIHPIDVLPARFSYEPSWADKLYTLGKVKLKALHIPGHTLGNQAFLLDDRYLFTGDSIFIHSIARPDLGGQAKSWTPLHYESLRKLMELPDTTIVLPAHFSSPNWGTYSSSLGELKKSNEGLLMAQKTPQEFSDYILASLPQFPKEYMDIKRINLGLLQVNEEQAAELELGKNVCAVKGVDKSCE